VLGVVSPLSIVREIIPGSNGKKEGREFSEETRKRDQRGEK
jgi:hypothetical protein